MTDITERLRSLQTGKTLWTVAEAANEIDRLREDVRTGEAWINTLVAKNDAAAERIRVLEEALTECRDGNSMTEADHGRFCRRIARKALEQTDE